MEKRKYIAFTEKMKKTYTILAPDMLPMHFGIIAEVLKSYGYNVELLSGGNRETTAAGLKYVHNDACYPAICVIGQFISALQSGKYDVRKVALIYFQTGGGCRASNYIFLIRKALERAGLDFVPVISLSLSGLEKHPGFRITVPLAVKMFYAIFYGDLLMSLVNQTEPYEINRGESRVTADRLAREVAEKMRFDGLSFKTAEKNLSHMIQTFKRVPVNKTSKIKVGVVGEIYVKFSALGNDGLNAFLVGEDAEVVVPGLLDFFMYTVDAKINDCAQYGINKRYLVLYRIMYRYLLSRQRRFISLIEKDGAFSAPTPFSVVRSLAEDYIDTEVKMGEGWLLTAEMLELKERGVKNVICAQPFGCLPNHIAGKGMMKPIKDKNPDMNIVAVDYDAGTGAVNRENRIKLMLANARGNASVGHAIFAAAKKVAVQSEEENDAAADCAAN